ncbi:MAG: hypothetical protein V4608_05990 [Bacteroidota bacterium]
MYDTQYIFKQVRKILFVFLLCILVWQQWSTFSAHQDQFLAPVEFTRNNYGNDYISQYGKRFEEARNFFTKPTILQYVGEANEDPSSGTFHYYLAQYYLAPNIVLNRNTVCDAIIYNLYNSKQVDIATNFHLNNGWHIAKNFNNGIIILSK